MLVELTINLPYKKPPSDAQGAALTRWMLDQLTHVKWPQTMPRDTSRMWGRIQDKLFDETDTIELDGSQFDFLNDLVKNTDLPPRCSNWLWMLRDYLEGLEKFVKDKPKLDMGGGF